MSKMKSVPIPSKKKKDSFFKDVVKNKFSYLIALPAIIYTLIFGYLQYPYLVIAFQRYDYQNNTIWKVLTNGNWVGFHNFKFFFESQYAERVITNTLYLNILSIVSGTFMAVVLALFLNELRCRWFAKITQSIMLFPNYLSWIMVSYILVNIFSTEYGVANRILEAIGQDKISWYTSPEMWPAILTIVKVWKGAGMSAVIYLAAITGIDSTLNEAAAIDGANRFQIMTRITLPLITPTIVILTLLSMGRIFNGDFGMIYALIGDSGMLYPTTDVIDTYLFRALRQVGDVSQSTAIGLFQSVVGFILVAGSNWLANKFYPDGALY